MRNAVTATNANTASASPSCRSWAEELAARLYVDGGIEELGRDLG